MSAPNTTLPAWKLPASDATPVAPASGVAAPRFTAASRVLRGAGAAALLAALSTFLWQHWQIGSDLMRAGALLAHTVGLTLAGLFCGLGARDDKAARSFLGLAGATLPILFCVGGGLVYSQWAWEGSPVHLARYATWVAPSPVAAFAAAAVILATAVPVSLLAMGVLARRRLGALAAACVVGNALLLVPTRDPNVVAVLAAALLAGLAALEWRVFSRETSLATFEGGLARVLAVAPAVLLLGRHWLHYEITPLFEGVCWLAAGAGLTALAAWRAAPDGVREVARWASLVPALRVAAAVGEGAANMGVTGGLVLPLAALCFGTQLVGASLVGATAAWGRWLRSAAGLGLAGACVVNLAVAPGIVASLLAGLASVSLLAWGTLREHRPLQLLGTAGALLAGAAHVQHAIAFYHWNRWGSLALLGVVVILAASGVERFGPRALARVEVWKRRFAETD